MERLWDLGHICYHHPLYSLWLWHYNWSMENLKNKCMHGVGVWMKERGQKTTNTRISFSSCSKFNPVTCRHQKSIALSWHKEVHMLGAKFSESWRERVSMKILPQSRQWTIPPSPLKYHVVFPPTHNLSQATTDLLLLPVC